MLDDATALELGQVLTDPVAFAEGILNHNHWDTAKRILRSVATHRRTAVKACHASSKTFTAADAAIWWGVAFPGSKVITTAPTWIQVEKLLWGNIKTALANANIKFPDPLKTFVELGPDNYMMGLSTDEGVRFQGWHGTILIILDEAPGVLPEIYEAIEGIRSGGKVHVLLLGNPTYPTGPFYDAFAKPGTNWNLFTINAFDTPNFDKLFLFDPQTNYLAGLTREEFERNQLWGKRNILECTETELELYGSIRPYLVQPFWVAEKYREWGGDHPLWESKVLGAFPSGDADMLVPLKLAEAARQPKIGISDREMLDGGIDVAGPGEAETSVKIRQGSNLIFEKAYAKRDPRTEVENDIRVYKDRLQSLRIDSIGNGYYFAQWFKDKNYPVVEVNVAEKAVKKDLFANRKAELYWSVRERFQQSLVGNLKDEETIKQISSIKWKTNPQTGLIEVESKEQLKNRGVPSPDRAESLMLCFCDVEKPFERKPLQPSRSFNTYG
jgi:hypothetical protein